MNNTLNINNILAIGAHFDDVELAIGGTLNKLSKNNKVYKLTLTDNVTLSKNLDLDVRYKTSKLSSKKACSILGVTEIPNKKIKQCSKLKYETNLMQYIEEIIFKKKIDTIFIHYDHDLNQDHIASSEICKTAARHCKNILMFQSNFYTGSKPFNPTMFVDITKNINKKISSLNCYQKEHNRNNQLFSMTIKRNEVWGYSAGVKYAEGFVPIKFCLDD